MYLYLFPDCTRTKTFCCEMSHAQEMTLTVTCHNMVLSFEMLV